MKISITLDFICVRLAETKAALTFNPAKRGFLMPNQRPIVDILGKVW